MPLGYHKFYSAKQALCDHVDQTTNEPTSENTDKQKDKQEQSRSAATSATSAPPETLRQGSGATRGVLISEQQDLHQASTGMVYVHLSDEERIQVLLVALAVFLAALLAAICLAGADCPLQRWLLERHLRRRRRTLTSSSSLAPLPGLHRVGSVPYAGPPPAYDAALRAARLEPLCLGKPASELGVAHEPDDQLNLGDYFHQPRDEQMLVTAQPTSIPWAPSGLGARPPAVMLRLWLRMLEPGELIERVRASTGALDAGSSERKRSLSRQLSIPHLFGSLVGLTGGAGKTQLSEQQPAGKLAEGAPEPNSLASTSSSTGSSNGPDSANGPIESRLLHMNVGSFSYVREGAGLVSAKKHQQLNRLHFAPLAELARNTNGNQPAGDKPNKNDKFCQLVISICDIENALAASRQSQHSCSLLTASSSLYVQCEILINRSKSARLLRALQPGPAMHTVELAGSSGAQTDGQAALVFTSLPRALASVAEQAGGPDLVQFDSVFVSPILHKARLLEGGQIRLRVRSQCKHLNETCLAEVKLPLKQLLRSDNADNLLDVPVQPRQQADLVLNNVLANLDSAGSGQAMAETLRALERAPSGDLQPSNSLDGSLDRLDSRPDQLASQQGRLALYCERQLLVSHWLSHLLAPAYECAPVDEPCGRILLGVTYLPTSNRVVFNAHRASLDNDLSIGRQLAKNLRLRSSTGYLLRFLMVLNGRVLRRKQTAVGRKPEWDSQEPITFDLVNLGSERPSFVVALVARDASVQRACFGSMQNLRPRGVAGEPAAPGQAQSEPESVQRAHCWPSDWTERARRDLVVGHASLGEDCWREMRAQPRKQLIRQLKMY